ncbi:MAG: aminotransferase class V-fold PLP-dependent enzyme [Promethearchaeota archaeon]
MASFSDDFCSFHDNSWINASSIGAMPRVAYEAAREVIKWNTEPYKIKETVFEDIPQNLKIALGKLIGAPAKEIILGNSASYGLHLWANGIPLQKGDEILLVKGDFPATILPWVYLRKKGIRVHEIKPKAGYLRPTDLLAALSNSTRILCATWVDSFTGFKLNANAISKICQQHKVLFLLNVTQGLGAIPFDVSKVPVDGITCTGYKWLCGPYATGFTWMKLEHINNLEYNQAYWIPMQGDRELDKIRDYQILTDLGAAQYDVFGTANLFNFAPWTESVKLFIKHGIRNIEKHNNQLVTQFINGLDTNKYDIHSPLKGDTRSAIILVSHKESERNKAIFKLLQEEKVYISFREGLLRFSPHLYNTPKDIDRALDILNAFE